MTSALPNRHLKITFQKLFLGWFLLVFISFTFAYDGSLFSLTEQDQISALQRREYFSKELGKVYRNRVGLWFTDRFLSAQAKYSLNIRELFSPHNYFYGADIVFLLSFLGMVIFLQVSDGFIIYLFITSVILSGFVNTTMLAGRLMMLPFFFMVYLFVF